jgi:hypothetical protein
LFTFLIVHSDKEGWVDMTLRAAGRVLGLTDAETEKAAPRLMEPDPHSTSTEEEGRRILAHDLDTRGIKIVNYEKYRAMRNADDKAAYQKRYYQTVTKVKRAANRAKSVSVNPVSIPVSHLSNHVNTCRPQAEAEAEAKTKTMGSKLPVPVVSMPKHSPEAFARFWLKYPRKKGRLEAIREWDRLKPSEVDLLAMSAGLERYVRAANPEFVMDPRRWLHGRRWEDQEPAGVTSISAPPRGPSAALLKAQQDREAWEREQARGA